MTNQAATILTSTGCNPSVPVAYHLLGSFLAMTGRPNDGIAMLDKAIRLSPRDPWMFDFFCSMAGAHIAAERYQDAAEWAQKSLERRPGYSIALSFLSVSLAHLGRVDEARSTLEKRLGKLSPAALALVFSTADSEFVQRFLAGLRKAGWEEDEKT